MAAPKTTANKASVSQFINAIADESRRKDCKALMAMMQKATNAKPVMWGSAIIGFGDHEYTGASGKPTKWFKVGFSPRKAALSLYLMGGKDAKLLSKLGKWTTSGTNMDAGCLYVKRLEDVNAPVLQKLIDTSVKNVPAPRKKETGG